MPPPPGGNAAGPADPRKPPPPASAATAAAAAGAALAATLPSAPDFEAYFGQLTAATPWPVTVRPSPAGGKGLFVTEAVKAGAPLLVDAPLVAAPQGFRSRARALACSACGAHAGGPAAQAAHALLASGRAPGPDVPALLRLVAGLDSLPAGAPQVRGTAAASGGSAPGGGRGGGDGGGGAWGLASSAPTPCPGGCGHELYCSPACAAADWAACHGAVCGGGGGSGGGDCARAAAADALAAVAAGGNDALWLAARAAGGCAARASAAVAADPSLSHADALRLAWTPWAMAEKALWWEQPAWPPAAVVGEESESESEEGERGGGRHRHRHRSSPPSSSGDGDGDASGSEAAFRAGLRGLVEEAAAALGVLLRAPPPLPTGEGGGGNGRPRGAAPSSGPPSPPPPRLAPPALAPLASPPVLGALVGAFELNNLEIDIPPLAACLEEEEEEAEENAGQHAKRRRGGPPASSWPALRAAAGPASLARAAVSGSAFYPIQACANHSCVPTARAVAGAGTHGLVWVEGCGGGGDGGDPSARSSTSTSSLLPPPLATAPVPAPASALLLAARDLEAGEEVTLCYVREEGGLEERADGLRDYGIFVCGCARCEREREGGDGAGGGAGEKNAPPPSRPAPGLVREGRGPTSAWVGAWRA